MTVPALIRLPVLTLLIATISVLPVIFGARPQVAVFVFMSIVMMGATLAVLVILARGAQADLEAMGLRARVPELASNGRLLMIERGVSIVFGLATVAYFNRLFNVSDWIFPALQPAFYTLANAGELMQEWLLNLIVFMSGCLMVNIVFFVYRQMKLFTACARTLDVDLMHTEEAQFFTLQPLRYLLVTVVFVSLNIILYQVLIATESAESVVLALSPVVLVLVLGNIVFLKPVIVVKNRIKEIKEREISALREALSGNREALQGSNIARFADEFAAPDLMMYEQYVRDIWEWPIQGYVQRIVFYVLLPPLAWVLAALVEQLVDGFVQGG